MKLKTRVSGKSKPLTSTIVMYAVASVIGLIAIALLVINVIMFKNSVAQYVAQGYPSAEVIQQLLPSQLLPSIFEPIAVYGGIALILFGVGMINQKVSRCLPLLVNAPVDAVVNDNNGHTEDVEQISEVIDETQQ